MTIFDFTEKSDCTKWRIVDDVVMGGNSNGNFSLNNAGNGLFTGYVSLENNGGFSMVQYLFNVKDISGFSKVCIKLKGDRKTYQFRVKSSNDEYHSYVVHFETSGDWETIEIPFNTMYPSFRGRKLNAPNFPGKQLEMIAFLIGNKRAEDFKLEIDSIILK
ncbi:CIA30 family protein [Seonamhaeicola sediminis]|uniref:CIA30 family protein n=1 Tax=Seonamhaeicola sediminis TaxID=2528206 RepID=A0A562YC00_9FLAO|nr:CIA30 family protein [Seonamhaeicola sediminis]TWO31808.1 CIA30 family protein [Seonamhaeicola sediminis]